MTNPVLNIKGLNKSFGALTVSDDIHLDLLPGEIHALIGPNGAGKSTLIKQIAGALPQDQGEIYFNGEEISHLDVAGRAKAGLGRSFQISSIIPEFSSFENLLLSLMGKDQDFLKFFKPIRTNQKMLKRAETYLDAVGLLDRAHLKVSNLSHGERRKLEIAMALSLEPKAFLLDEPMAGMGLEGAKNLTSLLEELKLKAPILLVEHDMDAVFALADRISVLVYGKIIVTGTVDEIRNHPEVREAYLGSDDA